MKKIKFIIAMSFMMLLMTGCRANLGNLFDLY